MKVGLLVRRLQLFKGKREGAIEAWPEITISVKNIQF